MAARLSPKLSDRHRQAIKTSMLVKRLQDFAFLHPDDPAFSRKVMTTSQIRSAEILLRKTLPDLSAVEFSGEVQKSYVVRAPELVNDFDDWQAKYGPKQLNG